LPDARTRGRVRTRLVFIVSGRRSRDLSNSSGNFFTTRHDYSRYYEEIFTVTGRRWPDMNDSFDR